MGTIGIILRFILIEDINDGCWILDVMHCYENSSVADGVIDCNHLHDVLLLNAQIAKGLHGFVRIGSI